MKRFSWLILLAFILILSIVLSHIAVRSDLEELIKQNVGDYKYYTTASYSEYQQSLLNAKNKVEKFHTIIGMSIANKNLRKSIDDLTKATRLIYEINYEFDMIDYNSVGDNWTKTVTYNGKPFENGRKYYIDINSQKSLKLNVSIVDNDTISDSAEASVFMNLRDNNIVSETLLVKEVGGRRYPKASAEWKFTCWCKVVERL